MHTCIKYTILVSVWQLGVQILTHAVNRRVGFMECAEGGWTWVYTSILGSVVTLLHMMTIMMQATLLLKVFHGVPKQNGYYDTLSVSPIVDLKDDDFRAA
jgi:hypothetical protein